ncbi:MULTISPECIES: helix-turn-helix domain-containing protein [Aneurinibacillus]|uniref:Helix-turn-helix transcriptional regulator n=1 Tax=Aneurinibacillus thermoaerophilus TaxID=143495 RepID=A0A1G8EV79_ANETH|nr:MULTISPECIES: helix-turn-helix transcriptional regulator [Aneurinibacillus]AMA73350.1 XRE family transcriptional regulator [Aneurinibacillus sp. XH2]MED0676008.1 helix-turn-helix transcriptional regulator [Aneurinibacillus thermoaerophilus]MED0680554.1 helix-turn-helix transcriptional regulator [Aneurinibacillus thermoaerophilus]MED0736291.1 helix-turn-helix transcriptional regulator [Aneurinibacillus thermoaerophilus]MED0758054.1 helix-turn-helix transcriptional regulator [Aneurinibacillus
MNLYRLYELRKRKKWSLQYIADQLGIAKSTYAGYESGYRQPSLDAIKKIADVMETSVDYLLNRIDNPDFQAVKKRKETEKWIELTDERMASEVKLTIDGRTLSDEEKKQFIAFVRARRQMENEYR